MLIERYQRYGSIGRPVNDSNIVLKVNYGLQLIQILDLDENKQILHTNCWSMYVSHQTGEPRTSTLSFLFTNVLN